MPSSAPAWSQVTSGERTEFSTPVSENHLWARPCYKGSDSCPPQSSCVLEHKPGKWSGQTDRSPTAVWIKLGNWGRSILPLRLVEEIPSVPAGTTPPEAIYHLSGTGIWSYEGRQGGQRGILKRRVWRRGLGGAPNFHHPQSTQWPDPLAFRRPISNPQISYSLVFLKPFSDLG